MMDCKKALTETSIDMEKAIEFLREKGLALQRKLEELQPKVLLMHLLREMLLRLLKLIQKQTLLLKMKSLEHLLTTF